MNRNYPKYPEWRKRVDRLHDKIYPVHSEKVFIKTMGSLWFWRWGFEHQGRIGPWRPDFVSHKRRLVIEIDGDSKVPKDIVLQQEYYDAEESRDMDLYRRGYSVLHVRYKDLVTYPNETRAMVKQWANNPAQYRRGLLRGRNR